MPGPQSPGGSRVPRPSDNTSVAKLCDALVEAQRRAQAEADARYEINIISPRYQRGNLFKNDDEYRVLADRYVTTAFQGFGLSPPAADGKLKMACAKRLLQRHAVQGR